MPEEMFEALATSQVLCRLLSRPTHIGIWGNVTLNLGRRPEGGTQEQAVKQVLEDAVQWLAPRAVGITSLTMCGFDINQPARRACIALELPVRRWSACD